MSTSINLYSMKKGEINNFLNDIYPNKFNLENSLEWKKSFDNPVEMVEFIGLFIDNNEKYEINMWISLDKDIFINVTDNNVNDVIKYLYERFPY